MMGKGIKDLNGVEACSELEMTVLLAGSRNTSNNNKHTVPVYRMKIKPVWETPNI